MLFFFFFSSRRRHTIFSRDWSSDVCSSDLPGNHDYVEGSPRDFLDYFGARTPQRTWFRVQVGDWWVFGLDSNLPDAALNEQQAWLEEQLKAIEGDGRCVLAMWHHPVFSTGLHRKDGGK